MASKAADFVARFVRLSTEGRAHEILQELKDMVMGIGRVGFEVSPQEETALRLKPNKMFKRALALMENKEAVASLLSLVSPQGNTCKEEYHLILGVLLKMSSIPSFAKEFGDGPAASPFLQFQRFLLPKVQAALRRRASWQPMFFHTACLYIELLNNLMQHSPRFATEALNSRIVHEVLRSIPIPAQPSLSWANNFELTLLTTLAEQQAKMLVVLQKHNPAGEQEFRLDDLGLLGDWLDRFLGYLDALAGPVLARGEGVRIGDAAGNVLRVVELVAHTIKCAGVVLAGGRAGDSGKLGKKERGVRVSVTKAESLVQRIQTAHKERVRCKLLGELQAELRKDGWEAEETQQLAAKGCFPVLIDVLEKQHRKADQKTGAVAGTFQGPVWPTLYILAFLAEPFEEVNNDRNKAFCQELADSAPRLLQFARDAGASIGLLELRMLLDVLFAAYQLDRDAKWDSRWPLLDVLLAANKRFVAGSPGSYCVWTHLYGHLALIPEPSEETRDLISRGRATPLSGSVKRATWVGVRQKIMEDVISGAATWGPGARERKLARAALDVLGEAGNAMLDRLSPVPYAAAALEFFCRFRCVLIDEVPQQIGPVISCLGAAYADMAGLVRTCEGRAPDREETRRWSILGTVATNLTFCLQTVLSSEPLAGAFLAALACNGGVSFAAGVLRTRRGAERYVWENLPEEKGRAETPELLDDLRCLAVRLWEALSVKYGLKECSFQECPRDVLETRKNMFKKCSACGRAQYCSKECQASHWKKAHKRTCRQKQDGT
ncbi:hypothetical protein KFL_004470080 [Klebsormidium nitens]|uniref:MYND-type domain-containing protein n=1 Tax=Klebsormidium nitens TaxID=105231 RepID=A0A1Y1IF61_KLENI|nr:hypothetical protein KFL_004470080 [Klebsormidium nitens]|eukprot:GAQ88642.1 hypothetical protein KFL_004470080 [Klebsormidium nitens]